MPEIEVFLMFDPSDRNTLTVKGSTTTEKGPNWTALAAELKRAGYTLTVHGPSIHPSVTEIDHSMKNAAVTLLIGHGSGSFDTSGKVPKWISNQIKLTDGVISSPDGLFKGQLNNGTLKLDAKASKIGLTNVTGIFTCNSDTSLPQAFDEQPGSHLITNDGGVDGVTRVGTLEAGAFDFVREYVRTKGDVGQSMKRAQTTFTAKGKAFAKDAGDTLHDRQPPPPPPKAAPFNPSPFGRGMVREIPP